MPSSEAARTPCTFRNSRRPCTLAAWLTIAAGSTPAVAQDWHWNAEDGDWSVAANWISLAPPPPSANVFIGSTATAQNALVDLDINTTIANLVITDGMQLFTRVHTLNVAGNTVVSGWNFTSEGAVARSRIILNSKDGVSLSTHDLTLNDEAQLYLGGGVGVVGGRLLVDTRTTVAGNGILVFSGSGNTLVNNGILDPGVEGGLILQQTGGGRFDLDGTSGDGSIRMFGYGTLSQHGTSMRLDGVGLSDAFSSELTLGPESDLLMNLSEGWRADASSEIRVAGYSGVPPLPSIIRGGSFDFAGHLLVHGPSGDAQAGRLDIHSSELTLRPQTWFELNESARVTLGGDSTTSVLVEGGTYDLAEGSILRFEGPTEIRGGTFTTFSSQPADGAVEFAGSTRYDGAVTFNGFARQIADAAVTGATTINADRFYMSISDETDWTISNVFTVKADQIGTGASVFRGDMSIGGALGRFNADLGTQQWTMQGGLRLVGELGFFATRVTGDDVNIEGSLTVPSGRAQIAADTFFRDGSSVNLVLPSSQLRVNGYTSIDPGTSFSGQGTLHNGPAGVMVLYDGTTLNEIELINHGSLYVAFDGGVASVDRFTNDTDGTLNISVVGYESGIQHDTLLVTGGQAILSGELAIFTFQVGPAALLPQIGDEFTILAALSGVTGTFSNDPVSTVGDLTYEWTVIYYANTIAIRLDNIIPAPGTTALLALAGLVAARRRRS